MLFARSLFYIGRTPYNCGHFLLQRSKAITKYRCLALTPFFFALQQALEGMVWLHLNSGNIEQASLWGLGFLFFAYIFWITWFPFLARVNERVQWKKYLFCALIITGASYGFYTWQPLINHMEPTLYSYNIQYVTEYPYLIPKAWQSLIYSCIGLLCLFTTDKSTRYFFALVLTLGLITKITHFVTWVSVWCFFSAAASACIYILLKYQQRLTKNKA